MSDLRADLIEQARAVGFADIGFCRPDTMVSETAPALAHFVAKGQHGDMGWMAERMNWRGDPSALWPEARTVIMLAENYGPSEDPLTLLRLPDRANVSAYAKNRDYHDIVKKRLKRLGRWLIEQAGGEIKVFVDTAPVMEKPLAEAAGLGWRGKHTNLVSRELGSWFFLGAIFTTHEFEVDERHEERCGGCRRCLDVCPTNAFPAPFQLDATRCISYLTIEHKGPIPRELRPLIGNHVYGCDDCLAVCPWNKFAQRAAEVGYWARAELMRPRLVEFAALDDTNFRMIFAGSPIKRIGRDRFLRNVLTAIGNTGDEALAAPVHPLLTDTSPLVRGAAVWALSRLLNSKALKDLQTNDPDPMVAEEWHAALAEN
ncbi:MAG: tRNA epoxyqueuosine(34) reductase QueG [Pikeienuella sp.]